MKIVYPKKKIKNGLETTVIVSSIFILLFLLARLVFNLNLLSFQTSITISLLLAIIIYLYILFFSNYFTERIDLFQIFIILSFPFLFGRHVLYTLKMNPENVILFPPIITNNYLDTVFFIFASLLALFIGYLQTATRNYISTIKINSGQKENLFKVSRIFFVISLVPFIINIVDQVNITRIFGYGYRIIEGSKEPASITGIIAGFFLPSVFGMVLAREKQYYPYFFITSYFILYTMTGSRINTFCYFALFLYFYFEKRKIRIYNSRIFKIFIMIFIFAVMLSMVSHSRQLATQNSENILFMAAEKFWQDGPLTKILQETGFTSIVTSLIIQKTSVEVPLLKGQSYISSLLYIIPNSLNGHYLNNFVFTDEAFSKYFTAFGGVGSSFIAEAYYNFGEFSIFMMIAIGFVWGWLSRKMDVSVLSKNYLKIFLYSQIFISLIFMIRSDMVYRIRPFVWYSIPIIMTTHLVNRRFFRIQ